MWTEGAPEFGWHETMRRQAFTARMKDQGLVSTDLDANAAFDNEFVSNRALCGPPAFKASGGRAARCREPCEPARSRM